MKVATSCCGRFHIFDQARQLLRQGWLHRLICDYPKFMTRKWGIPDARVTSLLTIGAYKHFVRSVNGRAPRPVTQELVRTVHAAFSKRLASVLPLDSDVFIGLSSFSLEAIVRAQIEGIPAIVDHGSLHQVYERQMLEEENELWDIESDKNMPPDWIIEKEQAEFENADAVIVLSRFAKKTLVANGVSAEKIFVNNCGVDLRSFSPGKKEDNVFRIIQCGGIHPRKGVQYLLQAFTSLQLPDAELWFIGGGLETTSLHEIIRRYAGDNIHFKGTYPQHRLRELYTQGSIFVLASVADGFGMVVPQAMACGLPVIVTDHVGASDLVDVGRNGFIVPARDVDALKERILFLYEHQDLCREMGEQACATVQSGNSWDDYGDRLARFLCSVSTAESPCA